MMIVLLFLVLKAFLFSILDDGIVKFGSSPEWVAFMKVVSCCISNLFAVSKYYNFLIY